jgi:5-(carboxyamino)imidazole ribonucleotide synthase
MRTGGYDGKGVSLLKESSAFENAFDGPSLIEDQIDFEKELSVIVARNEQGESSAFPVVECQFNKELNLVEFLFSPADIPPDTESEAVKLAQEVIEKLDMVGLLAVELFLTKKGELYVNEVAPRTHNSGHHTIECNYTSQFEQHLRAILGLPLGSTSTKIPGVMVNLLGSEKHTGTAVYDGIEQVVGMEGVYLHLYWKSETKPNRKMGHATITNSNLEKAKEKAKEVQGKIRIVSI